jgi:hypothetical protein
MKLYNGSVARESTSVWQDVYKLVLNIYLQRLQSTNSNNIHELMIVRLYITDYCFLPVISPNQSDYNGDFKLPFKCHKPVHKPE